jgi:hypothetical protein
MMPVLAIVRVRHPKGRFAIWAPVILLWLLMGVLALILAPFWTVYVLARGRNPIALAGGVCRLVFSLRGAVVDIDSPAASVLVRLI